MLKKLGQNPTDEETAELIRVCDVDKNGEIEFNEFCRYLVELRRKVSEIACLHALNKYIDAVHVWEEIYCYRGHDCLCLGEAVTFVSACILIS